MRKDSLPLSGSVIVLQLKTYPISVARYRVVTSGVSRAFFVIRTSPGSGEVLIEDGEEKFQIEARHY